jgi:hypothetical protein
MKEPSWRGFQAAMPSSAKQRFFIDSGTVVILPEG